MKNYNSTPVNKLAVYWSKFFTTKVFYVPVLGPVYNHKGDIRKLLEAILNNAEGSNFLAYDKNKRWFSKKQEKILVLHIKIENQRIYIPVIDNFKKAIKIFYYSNIPPGNQEVNKARKLARDLGSDSGFAEWSFYSGVKPENEINYTRFNIYIKKISKFDKLEKLSSKIKYFHKLPAKTQRSLHLLGKEPEMESFGFLWDKFISKNKELNPIFCAIDKDKIIGAIGPLDVVSDAWGVSHLLPPHFGVIKNIRNQGVGGKLWQAAMSKAWEKGAQYTLVQNVPQSKAAEFYEFNGLEIGSNIYIVQLEQD